MITRYLWRSFSVMAPPAVCPRYLRQETATHSQAWLPVEDKKHLLRLAPAPHSAMENGPYLTTSGRSGKCMSVGTLLAASCCWEGRKVSGQQYFCPAHTAVPSLIYLMTQRKWCHKEVLRRIYKYYICSNACGIEVPNSDQLVITGGTAGGKNGRSRVQIYTVQGEKERLPDLNNPRRAHACGYFYHDNKLVSNNIRTNCQ